MAGDALPEYDLLISEARRRRAAGDLRGAADSARRAAELRPHLAAAHHQLGLIEADRGDLSAAEACLRQAIECAPSDPACLAAAAGILDELGRPTEAEAFARRAIAAAPDACVPHLNLGLAMRSQGRLKRALSELEFAAGCADAVPEAALAAAELAAHLGRIEAAVGLLRAAKGRFGPHPQIDEGLAAMTGA